MNLESSAVVGMKLPGDVRVGKRSPSDIGRLEDGFGSVTPEKCEPALCRICFLFMREIKRAALR